MLYRIIKKIGIVFLIGFIFIQLVSSSWFLKHFYPITHKELIIENCAVYQIDAYLVLALIKAESRFNSNAYSRSGARGLMQIMPETGKWISEKMNFKSFTTDKLYEPSYNIPMGIWYIAYLYKNFDGNTVEVLAAYNAGESKVRGWLDKGVWTGKLKDIKDIPYKETRDYVERVMFNYQVYKRIYEENSKGIVGVSCCF
ncbi:MAG: lytic transglycosylase domain-containing protein [Clostridia bacterium]|nr:lytic transglycosylase domain-containing protein [Clostridia bacterium]